MDDAIILAQQIYRTWTAGRRNIDFVDSVTDDIIA
jgi:hypothetical protein